jgi:polyhydroxyalkanoate synthesis regulator protein
MRGQGKGFDPMHRIKKYANRKMYDVTTKRDVTMDDIFDLIQAGESITIIDNTSGKEITQEIVSQLVGRVLDRQAKNLPLSVLIELMRKGSGGLVDFSKKYVSFWQGALNIAEDELEKVKTLITKQKKGGADEETYRSDDDLENQDEVLKSLDQRFDVRLEKLINSREAQLKEEISQLRSEMIGLTARMTALENIFSQAIQIDKRKRTSSPKK